MFPFARQAGFLVEEKVSGEIRGNRSQLNSISKAESSAHTLKSSSMLVMVRMEANLYLGG